MRNDGILEGWNVGKQEDRRESKTITKARSLPAVSVEGLPAVHLAGDENTPVEWCCSRSNSTGQAKEEGGVLS
jgi:hypothetical protein